MAVSISWIYAYCHICAYFLNILFGQFFRKTVAPKSSRKEFPLTVNADDSVWFRNGKDSWCARTPSRGCRVPRKRLHFLNLHHLHFHVRHTSAFMYLFLREPYESPHQISNEYENHNDASVVCKRVVYTCVKGFVVEPHRIWLCAKKKKNEICLLCKLS